MSNINRNKGFDYAPAVARICTPCIRCHQTTCPRFFQSPGVTCAVFYIPSRNVAIVIEARSTKVAALRTSVLTLHVAKLAENRKCGPNPERADSPSECCEMPVIIGRAPAV